MDKRNSNEYFGRGAERARSLLQKISVTSEDIWKGELGILHLRKKAFGLNNNELIKYHSLMAEYHRLQKNEE